MTNTLRNINKRATRPRLLLLLVALVFALLESPVAALAHPLDQYVEASYITVGTSQVEIQLNLSPGVLLAPAVLTTLDSDGDQQISETESKAYVGEVVRQLVLQVDGEQQALTISKIEMPPYLNIQTGYGLIRVYATATFASELSGTHTIAYTNNFAPTGVTYQVNGFVEKGAEITLGKQNRDSTQQSMTMDYTIGGATTTAATTTVATTAAAASATTLDTTETTGASAQTQQLLAYMATPTLSPWVLLVALALAALLGGLHALTPGHGKTLVAAYLVGSRGTVRDAIVLGSTVTLTHTASVMLFGALALAASQVISATVLATGLEFLAALLVVGLGARLVWVRLRTLRSGEMLAHAHPHPQPDGGPVRPGALISLGLAGGALPCPEAMAVLLLAVGIGRIGLGLGLIVSFSLGLAAVLIALGIVLVRAGSRLARFGRGGGAWQRWLPLGSAVVVLSLGAAMLVNVLRRTALSSNAMLVIAGALAVFAAGYGLALLLNRRQAAPSQAGGVFSGVSASLLRPRYRASRAVSATPMGAAALKFDASGAVAWDTIWTDFCDLALAGGPPHRGTLLEAPSSEQVRNDPSGYRRVQEEIARGLRMVTGLPVVTDGAAGWIGLRCTDEDMALWMLRAITVENVAVRREGQVLFLPAGPDFALEREIKNVVTVVAKTYHYWTEHIAYQAQ